MGKIVENKNVLFIKELEMRLSKSLDSKVNVSFLLGSQKSVIFSQKLVFEVKKLIVQLSALVIKLDFVLVQIKEIVGMKFVFIFLL